MTAPSVAQMYPARRQPDGIVWYRAADKGGKLADGWTSDISQAHPDYHTTTTTTAPHNTKEHTMTALTEDFDIAPRRTEWMGYPLPPKTPRPEMKFNGWGWYQLPAPTTGRPTGFPRATTISSTLDDEYGLNLWKRRETVKRILTLTTLPPDTVVFDNGGDKWTAGAMLERVQQAVTEPKVSALDHALDTIDNMMGGAEARELGECVHAWLEALDMGLVLYRDIPDMVRPHVDTYQRIMRHRGLVPVPEYVERVVLNDQGEETVAGQIDRIYRLTTTGELVLGDIKTSKGLDYSWLPFGVQVGGVYGWATRILALDGKGWEPMPEIRRDFAVLMHIPSDQPERGQAITIDMQWGAETMVASLDARRRRKEAKVAVPRHVFPAPTDEAIRYSEAFYAVSAITTADEGEAVYEAYSDVWDDHLNAHAERVAELL